MAKTKKTKQPEQTKTMRVKWEIDIFNAVDHEDAARKALEIMREVG